MKYRDLEAVADWAYHPSQAVDTNHNVIALRQSTIGHDRHDRPHASEARGANAPAMGALEAPKMRAPVSRLSWIERLAIDFGIAGNALAFGRTFEAYPPQAALAEAKAVQPGRSALSIWLRAAVAGAYHGFLREVAIRSAVQELRRLDAATLRDIGIFDPNAIELFVRNGRAP